ncbi:MAG: four helix bundle protein [Dehalococcoidia bacterium]|nr:four helix bundle protein [Dehalococcoidia bacterium]
MTKQNLIAKFKGHVYRFALDVIGFVDQLPAKQTSRIVSDQLLPSTTSIGANVIEAQAASSRKDYTNFFTYALKSANECKFWLGLLRDSDRGDKDTVNKLLKEATEIANILATSILTLKGRK